MKKILIILFFVPLLVSGQSYFAKSVNGTNAGSNGDVVISVSGSQTLSLSYSDSILLAISGGNTIKFPYAVDSVGVNGAGDSIIVYKGGVRKSYTNGSSGGASLSGLTAATATNTIDNGAYQQNWNWNTLAGGIGLKLASNSNNAAGNTNTVFQVENTGTDGNQTTYAAKIINSRTTSTGTQIGLYAEAFATTGYALDIQGNYRQRSGDKYFFNGTTSYLGYISASTRLANTTGEISLVTGNTTALRVMDNAGLVYFSIPNISSTNSALVFGGDYSSGGFRSVGASATTIKRETGKLMLCANTGLGGGFGGFTPQEVLVIQGSTTEPLSNVGIGTSSPVASAKLEIVSTSKGILIPKGTTTNRDAISTPATLLQFGNTTLSTIDTYDGTLWTNGAKFLTNTATLDFSSTAAGAISDLTITVTGAADGDAVMLGVPNGSTVAAGSFSAWVSAANTVTVRYANNALVTSYDPASGTFKVTVNK